MHNKKNKAVSICLITPGHIATNPRLMKEVYTLLEEGFKVHIVFTQYMNYLLDDDALLLSQYPKLTYDTLKWVKKNSIIRIYNGIVQKLSKKLAKPFNNNITLHKIVLNRNYFWQYRKAVKVKADFYLAHNSGALAIAADAARKNGVQFGFDAEDFHRGEGISDTERTSLICLEDHYLPFASHLTAASELIAEAYEKIYQKRFITILNVFPKQERNIRTDIKKRPLQLFWFSQTIGTGRGLENVLKAMSLLEDKSPVLHLLGDVGPIVKKELETLVLKQGLKKENLVFYSPIFPDKIFELAVNFDIGIASEINVPINRDICLTNKIFTYIQSGLAVIASNTSAQAKLFNAFPKMGNLYQNDDISSLTDIIKSYQLLPERVAQAKQYCAMLGDTHFNWEIEKVKFINALNEII